MAASGRKARHGIQNWEDLRYVLTVVREGSYSAAARKLKRDHSTVRRRVEATQRALGIRLFQRTRYAMRLTDQARQIIDVLDTMANLAGELESRFAGVDARLAGPVRITTSEGFANHWMVPRMVRFQRENPLIRIELDSSAEFRDLGSDDADIAVRFVRPKQHTLVGVKVGTLTFGLFAARSYLDTFGRPDSLGALNSHKLIVHRGFIDNPMLRPWAEYVAEHPGVVFESAASALFAAALLAGYGVGLAPLYTQMVYPELELLPIPPMGEADIWLTTHADKRKIPRIATAFDYLRAAFANDRGSWFSDAQGKALERVVTLGRQGRQI